MTALLLAGPAGRLWAAAASSDDIAPSAADAPTSAALSAPWSEETDGRIRRELAALRAELEAYRRGESDGSWLDGARADAIRALVDDVLADASTRTSLQSSDMVAGYDGKAFIGSPDGSHLLRIHGFLQARWTMNHRQSTPPDEEDWTEGFSIRRARFFFDGTIETIGYRFRFTSGSDGRFSLDQAYADLPIDESGYIVRLGQVYLPLFRDDFVSGDGQLAVDSSVVNQLFNPGNSQGIQLRREWETIRFWLAFSDGLRSANRSWDDPADAEYALTGRVEVRGGAGNWSRFDTYTSYPGEKTGWMVGFGANWSGGAKQADDATVDLAYFTLDGTIEGGGWNVSAMGVLAYDNLDLASGRAIDAGCVLQGGLFVAPTVELFARYDLVFASDDRPGATEPFQGVTAGFTWYIAPNSQRLKCVANLIYFPEATTETLVEAVGGNFANQGLLPSDSGNQWAFQAQVQMQF
ncbi:MAG TPA: hypothetical protein PKC43_07765 [Phycisphaerales bacterium]|nr:hypothetical protein [Phycisphaerales bacterium]HMP37333.1 hypothetical protein [Phycisphaerales bacterium]